MRIDDLKTDIIMTTIISFIGFCVEDIWMIFRHGVLDNRNMYLPFLLGYGLFIIVLYYIIGTPKKLFNKYEINKVLGFVIYMLICIIIVSLGELLLGIFIEKTGGYSYWDYSSIPLHITKYTSVPTSIGFSLIITLFMNYIFEPLRNKIKNNVKQIPMIILIFVAIILISDFYFSFKTMYTSNGRNLIWQINFK